MKEVTIYTDGACSGNPGPGGWAAIVCMDGEEKAITGGERATTNNRMELSAVIESLRSLPERSRVRLYTDSQYISRALTEGWLENWKRAGFTKKGGLKNADLWRQLDGLLQQHAVTVQWVRGHADNIYNNRCDALATAQRDVMGGKM